MNDIKCIYECILSLNEITYQNFDIIIVNNGPKNKALCQRLVPISDHISKILNMGENVGFAKGNNTGITYALGEGAEYVLLLNDDTEVDKDFLANLVNMAQVNQDAGTLGPRIFFFDEPKKIWFDSTRFDPSNCTVGFSRAGDLYDTSEMTSDESDFITGCAVLMRRSFIEKVGLLNEDFFIYWEDVDLGLRSIKAGLKNLVAHNSHVWHKVTVSMGGLKSPRTIYHKTRSHLFLAKIHAPWTLNKLHIRFFRDIAWLLLKSPDRNRVERARAYISAIKDYHLERTGKGPLWLWSSS
nr:glycosyltransferase family 2 protein [Bacteroidota bacterium]